MPTIPYRVSTFVPWPTPNGATTNYGASYASGLITTTSLDALAINFVRAQFHINGTQVGVTTSTAGPVSSLNFGVRNLAGVYWIQKAGNRWYVGNPTTLVAGTNTPIGGGLGNDNIYMNGAIYTVANDASFSYVERFAAPGGTPGLFVNATPLDSVYSVSNIALGSSDTGDVYVMVNTGGVNTCKMWKFDAALNLIHFWPIADTVGVSMNTRGNFYVSHDMVVIKWFSPPNEYVRLIAIDRVTYALSVVGTPLLSLNSVSQSFVVQLDDCLGMDEIGVFSVCSQQPIVWQSP